MTFTGVRLRQWRSYVDQTFELESGVNIVVGPNASGKTNMLESLYVLAQGKSFRAKDKDLVMVGKNWTRAEANINGGQRVVKISLESGTPQKTISVDGTESKRLPVNKRLPVILFVPDHLQLLTGSPERRRNYLDSLIAQLYPARATTFSHYERALRQRNALLKHDSVDADQLFVWSVKLAELGSKINLWRRQVVDKLNEHASDTYNQLTRQKHEVIFRYHSDIASDDYQPNFAKLLDGAADRRAGFTTIGPHREDFSIMLDSKNSATAASRGETRSLVLVAKIVELLLTETVTSTKPLLLLDDVFSELDGSRRRHLAKRLKDYQTIITTTDADAVVEHFSEDSQNLIAL